MANQTVDSYTQLSRNVWACDWPHLMPRVTANLSVTEYDFHFGIWYPFSIQDFKYLL